MDFTIITPSRNYGHFMADCLASTANQPGVTLEHLVFDALSTDHTATVAASFPHIQWHCAADRGMSDAINRGFDAARGDWVIWLNADDRLLPNVLAPLRDRLNATNADVVYGDWNFIDESGNLLRRMRLPRWSAFVHIHHHCLIASTAAFYRRATVLEPGFRLREDFHYVMDGEFYARLNAAGKSFLHVPMCLADFRLHGHNASQRHLARTRDLDAILKAERQHIESRAIRRAYGFTPWDDPYLNGLSDGLLWLVAKAWKGVLKSLRR